MIVRWITQKAANEFVIRNHRHHGKVVGAIFQLGLFEDGELIGVAIVGRPVARKIDFRAICEVTRLCTIGRENACSKLYAACARIAKEMGFQKIITYVLETESGTSLKASGWVAEAYAVGGLNWNVASRARKLETVDLFGVISKYPNQLKNRWSKTLN